MSIDYIVSSLPTLSFGAPAPISWEKFCEIVADTVPSAPSPTGVAQFPYPQIWIDLETQLKNAVAEARVGNTDFNRPAEGCSLFWRNRILACFQEKDVARRDELLDRVWWDAAEELVSPSNPLGKGALAAYAVRLKIALKRDRISAAAGNAAFDRLTAETKIDFGKERT